MEKVQNYCANLAVIKIRIYIKLIVQLIYEKTRSRNLRYGWRTY